MTIKASLLVFDPLLKYFICCWGCVLHRLHSKKHTENLEKESAYKCHVCISRSNPPFDNRMKTYWKGRIRPDGSVSRKYYLIFVGSFIPLVLSSGKRADVKAILTDFREVRHNVWASKIFRWTCGHSHIRNKRGIIFSTSYPVNSPERKPNARLQQAFMWSQPEYKCIIWPAVLDCGYCLWQAIYWRVENNNLSYF